MSGIEDMSAVSSPLYGDAARNYTISGAREIVNVLRTTLGPKGLDKMLVDDAGNVVVTNDGVTILQEMAIDDPIGELFMRVAETQVEEAGDGTTTATLLAGELLDHGVDLLDRGVHPSVIAGGYQLAFDLVRREIDQLSLPHDGTATDRYDQVARTSITGKGFDVVDPELLVDMVDQTISAVTNEKTIDLDAIYVKRQVGKPASESEVFDGIIVTHGPSRPEMPTAIDDEPILLVADQLTVGQQSDDDEGLSATVTTPEQLQQFHSFERDQLDDMAADIVTSGARAVFYPIAIDDRLAERLADEDILAIQASKLDLKYLTDVTGADVVANPDEATADTLGRGTVFQDDKEDQMYVRGPEIRRSTVLVRGATEYVVDEIKRAFTDATESIGRVTEDPRLVPGGGATEIELARRLRIHANSVPDREHFAIKGFASSVEAIPRMLAANAGLDGTDTLLELRSHHDDGEVSAGLDLDARTIADMEAQGVLDPVAVKLLAMRTATAFVCQVLRVDGVLPLDSSFNNSTE